MGAIGLLLSDDLLFISRIVGTARDLGLSNASVTGIKQKALNKLRDCLTRKGIS